jgi:CTP synthase
MVFSGTHEKLNLVEMIEIPEHPFFIACQFHPEFLSRPLRPHPIFKGFIEASILNKKQK